MAPFLNGLKLDKVFVKEVYCLDFYTVFINDLLNCLENVSINFGVYNVKSTNPALADDIACLSLSPAGLKKC